jgi:hypothetical protein
MNRKALITVFAALALGFAGAVSSAQAGDRDDGPSGGYRVGPLGQSFGDSYNWTWGGWPDTGTNAYGFAPAPAHYGHKHPRTR